MGTRRSRHNRGRKPFYKEHRAVASHLLANPRGCRAWSRTWWTDLDEFKLGILAEANADIEGTADVLGRQPSMLAHRCRDTGIVLPKLWAQIIAPKRKPQLADRATHYPYIITRRDEHADLLAVNAIVPAGIPDNMRADICQEIMLAILEGRTTLEMLKARNGTATYFIKKFYHDNYEAGGHAISFNDTDENWDSDAVAASIAAKEWHREQFLDQAGYTDSLRVFTPPAQFEAAWRDQIGRIQLKKHELGQFLSRDEVEELLAE